LIGTTILYEEVVKDRTLISVSVLAILSQLVTFATVYGFTPLYASSLGASKFDMSLLTVFSTLSMAIASLYGGKLSERFGEKAIVVFGFILAGIFTSTIAVTENLTTLIITQTIAGFGRGASFTMLMGLSIKYMPLQKRATAMGFFQSIYGLGMFVGPFIMGFMGDFISIKEGFVYIGFIACMTAILALIILKPKVQN
jgi:MFS family permease